MGNKLIIGLLSITLAILSMTAYADDTTLSEITGHLVRQPSGSFNVEDFPPVIEAASEYNGTAGELVTISVNAYDPNGQSVAITFSSPLNSSGQWQTTTSDGGIYYATINASDGILYTTHTVTIILVSFCGDGVCNGNESCSDCALDCGSCTPGGGGGGGSSGGGAGEDTGGSGAGGDAGGEAGGGSSSGGGAGITGKTLMRPEHLLDISTRILDDYKIIIPGGKVLMELTLYNLGTEEMKDITIRYCIETDQKEIIKCNEETVAVYTKIQTVKDFLISKDIAPGEYFIKTEASYRNETAKSEISFEVVMDKKSTAVSNPEFFDFKINKSYLIIGIISLMSLILLTLILIMVFKSGNKHQRVAVIESKLQQLKELRTRGELSRSAYHAERGILLQRIQNMFKGKPMFLVLLGISLVALARIFIINRSITGYITGGSASTNSTSIWGYVILLIGALGLLMFIHRQKIKESIEKHR